MSLTPSTMLPLGTSAPDFNLPDTVSGATMSPDDFSASKALLVVFAANHCPYAVYAMPEVINIANDYAKDKLAVIAISSNDVTTHPMDGPEQMKELAEQEDYPFPYLYDESQEVAKAYTAACTPDFFLFDQDRNLVYRGQLDDSRPGDDKPLTGEHLRSAIAEVLEDKEVSVEQKPSVGCNIKWKAGNAPDYFA